MSDLHADAITIRRPSPGAFLAVLVAVLGVLVLFDFVAWISGREAAERFSLDGEITVATWWASLQLVLLAVLFAVEAQCESSYGRRAAAWTLRVGAVVAMYFAIDETAGLHEAVTAILRERHFTPTFVGGLGFWSFVYLIATLAILLVTFPGIVSLFSTHRTDTVLVALGGAVFVLGGVVVEDFANGVNPHGQVVVEEILEFLGIAIMAWAVYRMIGSRDIRLRLE